MSKKGEMGVGTLIIFIAMLLVAAVAAGVLIQTVSSLQEKSLATGQEARAQISTNAEVIEVSATDGRDGSVEDFQQLIKLSPGSDPIKLDDVIFTFSTDEKTASLQYRGVGSNCERGFEDGYVTAQEEEVEELSTTAVDLENDYSGDGETDTVKVADSGDALTFNLSGVDEINVSIGENISDASEGVTLDVEDEAITDGDETYGYVTVTGETNTDNTLDDGVTMIVTPANEGEGYFSAVYEQEGSNHREGNLGRGDIVKLCFEAPGKVSEEESVRLNFIPKIGTASLTEFTAPDVISTERVYLYP